MEAFNSTTQVTLFNVEPEHVLEDRADSFLSGLSRAFTLASARHEVQRGGLRDECISHVKAVGLFTNAQGEQFKVEVTRVEREVVEPALTPASLDLFLGFVEDAPNWSGTPLVTVTPAQRGNLADLKKKGLLTTWEDEDGCVFVNFTETGIALAVARGFDGSQLRLPS